MIVACYAVWNEAAQIAASIRSVKAYVDRFVVVDSAWTPNPVEATHSTDATREVCEVLCDPVPMTYIESDRKLRQEEARNRYLAELDASDWAFVIDGDEVLQADHAEAIETFRWLGEDCPYPALSIPVLTSAVLFDGSALEMPLQHYYSAPVIHTRGHAPRLFRVFDDVRYKPVVHRGILDNMGVWAGDRPLSAVAVRDDRLRIVNHHVGQTFEAYQADAVWETANVMVPA